MLILLLSFLLARSGMTVPATDPQPPLPEVEAPADPAAAAAAITKGNSLYFSGSQDKALSAYEQAVKISSRSLEAWLNGGAVLDELGQPVKAARWYARAGALSAKPAVLNALGAALFRAHDLKGARTAFERSLSAGPENADALLGLARIDLAGADAKQAVLFLKRAAAAAPLLNLTYYFMGKAYEGLNDQDHSIEAYRQGVTADSYFMEAREALARAYLRRRSFNEAWRQFTRILSADPNNSRIKGLIAKVQPLITPHHEPGAEGLHLPAPYLADSPTAARVPILRVGIGTSPMGKPRARAALALSATSDFVIEDAASGAPIGTGKADEFWTVRLKPLKKKKLTLELTDPSGRVTVLRRGPFRVRPAVRDGGLMALAEARLEKASSAWKLFRGEVEISLFSRTIRIVNVLDLENYTHGVLASEMPIRSPMEALKAQAILARSHALFIKLVTRRHRKDGYDVCDEQHCQVYSGVRAENERSRGVVEGSRGSIVTYKGKVAHVIYSSNCGGHTQSGSDLTGWGDVPYWKGVADGPALPERPASPWALRQWLSGLPSAYCKPSTYVHPAHFRWTRVIAFSELGERVGRRYKLGRLKAIRPLRRSPSGNVNALMLIGTKKSVKVDSEMTIRGLLGMGSLRSTLFIFDTEFDKQKKPEWLIFHGGGWGHGVGMCQSGAMGRAEAGQSHEEIIKAYFPGTLLGRAEY